MGWSERGLEPRDAEQVTEELHALLNDTGIEGPYVVVGHPGCFLGESEPTQLALAT
jgi:hypothetical protein